MELYLKPHTVLSFQSLPLGVCLVLPTFPNYLLVCLFYLFTHISIIYVCIYLPCFMYCASAYIYLIYLLLFINYFSNNSFWISRASRSDWGKPQPLEYFCLCPAHAALWLLCTGSIHWLGSLLNWNCWASGDHGEESPTLAACSRQEHVRFVLSKYILDASQPILEHVHSGSCMQSVFQAFVKMKSRWTKAFDEAVKLESWKAPCRGGLQMAT